MKNKRNIVTFEPENDVLRMLTLAKKGGLVIGEVLNKALRDCGQDVIRNMARERASQFQKLSDRSFNMPAHQLAGFSE